MAFSEMRRSLRRSLIPLVSRLLDRLPVEEVERLIRVWTSRWNTPIFSPEYPVDASPRWTHKSPHSGILKILCEHHESYLELLRIWAKLEPNLRKIPLESPEPSLACWRGGWIPALDAISIYGFLATTKPEHYVEIGCGRSTTFARRAIQDFDLKTQITSIDPAPRAEINSICDRTIRHRLEQAELRLFEELHEDDILFVDNSHRILMNSDVTVFFLDVLQRLRKGVIVGIHDICWPVDYPKDWTARYYSEQYLLAPLILGQRSIKILFPGYYASIYPRPDLSSIAFKAFWEWLPPDIPRHAGAFWFIWNGYQ
jgi:hypothetical protein